MFVLSNGFLYTTKQLNEQEVEVLTNILKIDKNNIKHVGYDEFRIIAESEYTLEALELSKLVLTDFEPLPFEKPKKPYLNRNAKRYTRRSKWK